MTPVSSRSRSPATQHRHGFPPALLSDHHNAPPGFNLSKYPAARKKQQPFPLPKPVIPNCSSQFASHFLLSQLWECANFRFATTSYRFWVDDERLQQFRVGEMRLQCRPGNRDRTEKMEGR